MSALVDAKSLLGATSAVLRCVDFLCEKRKRRKKNIAQAGSCVVPTGNFWIFSALIFQFLHAIFF